MAFTPQTIITKARHIMQDTDSAGYRQSNDELVLYVNAGLLETSVIRPEWFQSIGHVECTVGTVEQTLTFADAQALVRVIGIHEGRAMTPFDLDVMNAYNPTWKTDTPAAAKQWAAYPGDQLRFFLDAPAPASQNVDVLFTKNPTAVALATAITEVPQSIESALVDYVVSRAESKDDENVLNQRAVLFYGSFVSKIKGASA